MSKSSEFTVKIGHFVFIPSMWQGLNEYKKNPVPPKISCCAVPEQQLIPKKQDFQNSVCGCPAPDLRFRHHLFFMASSKATSEGEKLIFFVKAQASVPPKTRSMPLSSHSMDKGPS